ncbi:pyocin activator PrtN family protein [Wielerella bovis]|uniref:pyocin activator PrtN family protein n=1 Tax=Wielerella bovis TaxID=2917790 RepID=UPI0020189BDE|nr:pyocin activator PrtN family protein [Wielerella bovis]ULJ66622.1 pyocin activator PrtN family protein [Wielerella bovis]
MKPDTPSTAFTLTMCHQSTVISLEDVIKKYLPHMSIDQAKRRAAEQTLPFPAFKADKNSKKSPYMVRVDALAAWLDNASEQAQDDWNKVNK